MGQVDADLVGAAGFQLTGDQAIFPYLFQEGHMGDSCLGLAIVYHSFSTIVSVSSDFMAQDQLLLGESPLTEGQVFSGNPLVFQEPIEDGKDKGIFGKENGATGLHIQPVDHIAGLANIGRNMIEEGNFCRLIAVGFHAFWLINNNQVFILIEFLDQTGVPQRDAFFRIVFLIKGQFQQIARTNRTLPVHHLAIDPDLFFGPQKMADFSWDEKVIFQQLLDGHGRQAIWDGNGKVHTRDSLNVLVGLFQSD